MQVQLDGDRVVNYLVLVKWKCGNNLPFQMRAAEGIVQNKCDNRLFMVLGCRWRQGFVRRLLFGPGSRLKLINRNT